jgi:ribose-phosphate pyrophosphokinase
MSIYLNNTLVIPTIFPDGTSQIWKIPEHTIKLYSEARVVWKFQNEAEFIHLSQLKHLLDSYNIQTFLEILYMPYARQDKGVSNNSTFALYPFCKLLKSLNFLQIFILDPHSKTTLELLNAKGYYPSTQITNLYLTEKYDTLCYPDKGAVEKYSKKYIQPFIYADKIRDQLSGNILSIDIVGDCKDKKILIVDDICDYGNTFIKLAEQLYKHGAKDVDLFITHGLFSGGVEMVKKSGIKNIYTPDGLQK